MKTRNRSSINSASTHQQLILMICRSWRSSWFWCQVQLRYWCQSRQVCTQTETLPSHFSYSSSSTEADEACSLPGGIHTEHVNSTPTSFRNTEFCRVWIYQERWHVTNCLDHLITDTCQQLTKCGCKWEYCRRHKCYHYRSRLCIYIWYWFILKV